MDNDLKYSLYNATKRAADKCLEAIRNDDYRVLSDEAHAYKALYELIKISNLEEDYQDWEW